MPNQNWKANQAEMKKYEPLQYWILIVSFAYFVGRCLVSIIFHV